MNKIYAWILGMTKVGKALKKAQEYLDGKKQIFISIGAAVPATLLIIQNFTDEGLPYLIRIAGTPEFTAASLAWIGFFNGLGVKKMRAENAEIIQKISSPTVAIQK